MNSPSSRLNLIQRAMRRSALNQEGVTPPRVAVPLTELPVHAPSQDLPITGSPSIGADIVGPLQVGKATPVRLDFAKAAASRICSPENQKSITYNEFRSLKRKLLPMIYEPDTGATKRNLVMVTSALPGEGKTFTTMNLAIALAAEPNLNVIVVDADVVQSSLSSHFLEPGRDGLLELLTGKRQRLEEVLHPCKNLPRLHVLFAGAQNDAAPELLASSGMAQLCASLSTHFEQSVVLFDTPPVLAAAEPAALAAHVNHVLMVVSAGTARRDRVEAALSEVSRCPSINLVFNRSPQWERPLNDAYARLYSLAAKEDESASA